MSVVARLTAVALVAALLGGCMTLLVGGSRDGRSADEIAVDNRIVSIVNERLMRDDVVRERDITVSSVRRVVTLRGTVHSDAARQRAIDLARDVPDVARVVSLELTVR